MSKRELKGLGLRPEDSPLGVRGTRSTRNSERVRIEDMQNRSFDHMLDHIPPRAESTRSVPVALTNARPINRNMFGSRQSLNQSYHSIAGSQLSLNDSQSGASRRSTGTYSRNSTKQLEGPGGNEDPEKTVVTHDIKISDPPANASVQAAAVDINKPQTLSGKDKGILEQFDPYHVQGLEDVETLGAHSILLKPNTGSQTVLGELYTSPNTHKKRAEEIIASHDITKRDDKHADMRKDIFRNASGKWEFKGKGKTPETPKIPNNIAVKKKTYNPDKRAVKQATDQLDQCEKTIAEIYDKVNWTMDQIFNPSEDIRITDVDQHSKFLTEASSLLQKLSGQRKSTMHILNYPMSSIINAETMIDDIVHNIQEPARDRLLELRTYLESSEDEVDAKDRQQVDQDVQPQEKTQEQDQTMPRVLHVQTEKSQPLVDTTSVQPKPVVAQPGTPENQAQIQQITNQVADAKVDQTVSFVEPPPAQENKQQSSQQDLILACIPNDNVYSAKAVEQFNNVMSNAQDHQSAPCDTRNNNQRVQFKNSKGRRSSRSGRGKSKNSREPYQRGQYSSDSDERNNNRSYYSYANYREDQDARLSKVLQRNQNRSGGSRGRGTSQTDRRSYEVDSRYFGGVSQFATNNFRPPFGQINMSVPPPTYPQAPMPPPIQPSIPPQYVMQPTQRMVPTKLPPLKLLFFNGNPLDYKQWRNHFESCVLSNPTMPVSEKAMRLRTCLGAEPLGMIQYKSATQAGLQESMAKLDEEYGSEEIQDERYHHMFQRVTGAKETELDNLQLLMNTLEAIESENPRGIPYELTWVKEFMDRLSSKMQYEFRLYRAKYSRPKTIQVCKEFLKPRIKALRELKQDFVASKSTSLKTTGGYGPYVHATQVEQEVPPIASSDQFYVEPEEEYEGSAVVMMTNEQSNQASANPKVERNKDISLCTCCGKEKHRLFHCSRFKEMKRDDRAKFLLGKSICFSCLDGIHKSEVCVKPQGCLVCHLKSHHTLLHRDFRPNTFQNRNTAVKTPAPSTGTNAAATTTLMTSPEDQEVEELEEDYLEESPEAGNDLSMHMTHMTSKKDNQAVRAVPGFVSLTFDSKKITANILIDELSSESYIIRSEADALGAKGRKESAYINVLNDKVFWEGERVELVLTSADGKLTELVYMSTVDNITSVLKPKSVNDMWKKWDYLKDIPFNPLDETKPFTILLGMDYSHLMVSLGDMLAPPFHPQARRTPLGWTVLYKEPRNNDPLISSSTLATFFMHTCLPMTKEWPDEKFTQSDEEKSALRPTAFTFVGTTNGGEECLKNGEFQECDEVCPHCLDESMDHRLSDVTSLRSNRPTPERDKAQDLRLSNVTSTRSKGPNQEFAHIQQGSENQTSGNKPDRTEDSKTQTNAQKQESTRNVVTQKSNVEVVKNAKSNVTNAKRKCTHFKINNAYVKSPEERHKFIDPNIVPNYAKLIQNTMYALCIQHTVHEKQKKTQVSLREYAELLQVRMAQEDAYKEERKRLKSQKKPLLAKDSRLRDLCPILDKFGVMRVFSRAGSFKELNYDEKRPMIIPPDHPLTVRILDQAHKEEGHLCGIARLMNNIRQKFWIPRLRQVAKSYLKLCVKCKRSNAKPSTQIMGEVDSFRASMPIRAFAHTALDYFGPYEVRMPGRGRTRMKRYVLIATCAKSRAVHLEVCESLDTDALINALYRFTYTRSVPEHIRSDNGRSFVKGNKIIQELLQKIDWTKVKNVTGQKGVKKWTFSPAYNPHHNSLAEIMVKASKKCMNMSFQDRDLTDFELLTVVKCAEGLLNSRPLTYISDDPDGTIITPNHMLFGMAGGAVCPHVPEALQNIPKDRWIYLQTIVQHFWKKWLSELIPMLHGRPKWRELCDNVKENDIVVFLDKQNPRGLWPLARVKKVYPGRDGHVRSLDVELPQTVREGRELKVIKTVYNRGIRHVCPTGLFSENDINMQTKCEDSWPRT